MLFLALSYFAIWQHEFLPVFPENPGRRLAEVNQSLAPMLSPTMTPLPTRFERAEDPLAFVFSLQAIAILLTGVLLVVNGYFLVNYVRRKEHREIKKFVTSSLLTSEEKTVYEELIKRGGEATQKQLALDAGFSPVKVYRVLKRLEGKKVVKSFPYGMTKKIILNEA